MLVGRTEARATRLLYLEIVCSSIPGGIITFNGAYLLRLGGSSLDVSLLTALPALAAVLVSVPAGHFLQSRAHPQHWVLGCLALYWTGFLLLAFVPWVRVPGLGAGPLVVAVLALASLATQVFTVGIFPLLADMVPERRRVHVFAIRALINACMLSVVTLAAGQWLNRAPFPGNYQWAYVAGWVCGLAGVALLAWAHRLPRPPLAPRPDAPPPAPGPQPFWPADLARQPDFVRFTFNTLLHSLALWLAAPLYTLFFVRELGASDAWLGLYGTVAGVSTIGGLLVWRWVAERLHVGRTLRLTVIGVGLMPLLTGLVPHLAVILVFTAINGFFTAGITVSHVNVLLDTLPADRRPQFIGLFSSVLNLGAFAAPLLAVALADRIGLGPTLVLCGLVGLVGALAHWVWRVPGRQSQPAVAVQPSVEGA